jgi:hypothetical protein
MAFKKYFVVSTVVLSIFSSLALADACQDALETLSRDSLLYKATLESIHQLEAMYPEKSKTADELEKDTIDKSKATEIRAILDFKKKCIDAQ